QQAREWTALAQRLLRGKAAAEARAHALQAVLQELRARELLPPAAAAALAQLLLLPRPADSRAEASLEAALASMRRGGAPAASSVLDSLASPRSGEGGAGGDESLMSAAGSLLAALSMRR
ncbi:MAG: hypothetical protein ACK40Z_14840, partial [Dietzia sp.]